MVVYAGERELGAGGVCPELLSSADEPRPVQDRRRSSLSFLIVDVAQSHAGERVVVEVMAVAAYGQSKLDNLLFTGELARRAAVAGSDLLSVAAHPGYAATNAVRGRI